MWFPLLSSCKFTLIYSRSTCTLCLLIDLLPLSSDMFRSRLTSLLVSVALLHARAIATPQLSQTTNTDSPEIFSKREYFYVGGQYVAADPPNNGTIMTGQVYVEHLLPLSGKQQKYPLVFWHGAAQTGTNWLNTPDGREGWASYFLNQGYEVVSANDGSLPLVYADTICTVYRGPAATWSQFMGDLTGYSLLFQR